MAVTTELLLARHGEAACNVTGIVGGDSGCTGLTPHGRQQVEHLAQRLIREHADRPFEVVYATPRRRVRETADIITQALGLSATIEAHLRGPDHGEADGRPWHDVKTTFGGPPQHDPDQPYAAGSESWNAYLERATRALEEILTRHEGQRVLVLAHGETIQAAHTLLLGLAPGTCRHAGFVTDHACLTRWQRHINRLDQVVWMLAAHNDTPVAELVLPPEIERDLFGQAGALLAAWHNAEPPHDTPDMTAWLGARGEQWLHLAEPILSATQQADIRAHLRDLTELGALPTMPCHLDFTPRNLLYAPDGAVGVIDFEHARYDLAARDLVQLSNRVWRDRPDLQDAFLTRYGPLSDLDHQVIEHCTYLDALTAAVRATGRTLPVSTPP